jgi:hypothetical protein
MIQASDVTVELRLATKADSQLRAFADVTVSLGESGDFTMFGWSVIGDPPRVVPPARKGDKRFFDVLTLSGKVKTLVYTVIGMEYQAAVTRAGKASK